MQKDNVHLWSTELIKVQMKKVQLEDDVSAHADDEGSWIMTHYTFALPLPVKVWIWPLLYVGRSAKIIYLFIFCFFLLENQ